MIALFRTELTKAARRLRTVVMLAGLAGLTVIISLAVHARSNNRPDRGDGLFVLARQSGLVVPAALMAVMSAFLLVVVSGMIIGDAIAGDAASGNLRYLLMRPVSRSRVLLAKGAVAGFLIWCATLVVAVTGLIAGTVLFGWKGITVPAVSGGALTTFHLSASMLLVRLAFAAAYIAIGYSALLGVGLYVSTTTDVPAGAVSATVGVYIVSEILDSITDLGSVRYGLPTHYQSAWESIFTRNVWSGDLVAGVVVQSAYLAVFAGLAFFWFNRKDIRC
jgi:ABC-2 type transport system permease protein